MQRRSFLHTAAASVAVGSLNAEAWRQAQDRTWRVAVIGTGWFGMWDLNRLMDVADVVVVGLCDVDSQMLAGAVKEVTDRGQKKPPTFDDHREMLQAVEPELVIVGTPDHWHALCMIDACAAGAHVYVEKPISVDVVEGQAMVAAARRHDRTVQVGTQRRSTPHIADAREFVKGGGAGDIGIAKTYCYYNQGSQTADTPPVPDTLDYDRWCGPAPKIEYNSLIHPRSWRKFMEYGNGTIGDMGVHMLDTARWILGLEAPKTISGSGGIYFREGTSNIPDTQDCVFDFGDTVATWEHRHYGRPIVDGQWWGLELHGTEGLVRINLDEWQFLPHGKGAPKSGKAVVAPEIDKDANVAPANRIHMKDWLAAIVSGDKPVADIEEGHVSSLMCILGNLSAELGRSFAWDGDAGRIVGDDEANARLARKYRDPWQHPTA